MKFVSSIRWLGRVVGNAGYKFYWDDCFSRASSLAYTTLFALVPIAALSFSIVEGFGMDQADVSNQIQRLLNQVLPPDENELLQNLQNQVFSYINLFSGTVRSLGVVSIGILIFTSVALLNTIESALNVVWRVTSDQGIISKFTNFWAVITAGPLLFSFSFYWYTKVGALQNAPGWYNAVFPFVDFIVPIASIWFALTLMFYKLPAAKVSLRDAALGALFSAVVFEFVKRGFAYYISTSTTYSKFYGVLTSIPLFLFWVYLVWIVILFGAEISYQAGSIHILRGLKKYANELGEIGAILGLRILHVIGEKFVQGEAPPSEQDIVIETGSDPVLVRSCLEVLTEANFISRADNQSHSRSLVRNPDTISVDDVFYAFHSKSYRAHAEKDSTPARDSRELQFLESLRMVERKSESSRPLKDWTLAEIITADQSDK